MLVTGAALAGCGQAGTDEEPVAEPAPAVSIPGDLDMGVEGEPSRSRDASSSPGADDDGSEDNADADASAVDHETCVELQQAWSATNRALVDLSPEHPRALVQSFRTADKAMAAAEPPEDLAEPWGAMADYLGSAVTAFQDVDEDDASAVSSAVADAITADDTADATTAAKDITAFLSTSCAGR
ncbi:hypothetical protein SAMN04324258_3360 [Krasilnikoviella flava]|uniref:Uncharacterized protein n=2 Tax=Krasilnikoviella flava TaxID=526729 RepID=A0A1T5LGB9_9MICO|nr:hypothetical protein SAMN04324258_3360 [Krasilnikoviella flava]